MISEFKMGLDYKEYILNLLVKTDEKIGSVLVIGKKVEGGMQHGSDGDLVVDTFDLPSETDEPSEAKAAFEAYLADGGEKTLDEKIAKLGEGFFMGFMPDLVGEPVEEPNNDLRIIEGVDGGPVVIEMPVPQEFETVVAEEEVIEAEIIEEEEKPKPQVRAKPKPKKPSAE